MSEKNILFATIILFSLGFISVCYINHENLKEIETLKTSNKALIEKLNIKGAELQTAKNDLNETHEVMGELFLASMELTDKYNKIKKQCRRR